MVASRVQKTWKYHALYNALKRDVGYVIFVVVFFFFQAEDGIRDVAVTGVQTCALPIFAGGRFREDLYHRLSVVPIRVPPLSERREDIPELIDYFMDQISVITGLPKRQIGQDAMAVLQSHIWPGNVRQLRNNVERVMILAGGRPGGND